MTYKTIPLNVTGPSYKDRSRPISVQETRNLYHEYIEEGQGKYVLHSFPGFSSFGSVAAGVGRGSTRMDGVLYRVVGTSLYSVSSVGTHTLIGTIAGTSRCTFANDGDNLFIANGSGQVYWYNKSTLVTVTDPDIVGATAVDIINNQFIYTKPTLFIVSDVGDGSSASGLNAAGAEVKPDKILRGYVFDQLLYLFGERTVERWYNTGTGSPPFARYQGQLTEVGCSAAYSIANTANYVYWLGDDRSIWRERGGAAEKVSSNAIANEIENYADVSDAYAFVFTFQGMEFYAITFPTADKTYCLNETLGNKGWFELSSGDNGGAWSASSVVSIYNKTLVSDISSGDLWELDIDAYDHGGTRMVRRRVTAPLSGLSVGAPGQRLKANRLELLMEKGVGLISGQGEDPKVMVEISYDGGKSYAPATWMRIGRLGETQLKAETWLSKSFYEAVFRFTITDPVNISIYGAALDIKAAGR